METGPAEHKFGIRASSTKVGPRDSAEQRLILARHFFAEAAGRIERNLAAVSNGGNAALVAAAAAAQAT